MRTGQEKYFCYAQMFNAKWKDMNEWISSVERTIQLNSLHWKWVMQQKSSSEKPFIFQDKNGWPMDVEMNKCRISRIQRGNEDKKEQFERRTCVCVWVCEKTMSKVNKIRRTVNVFLNGSQQNVGWIPSHVYYVYHLIGWNSFWIYNFLNFSMQWMVVNDFETTKNHQIAAFLSFA